MNKNRNNTEPKKTRMLTDEEAEQVTGGQNSDTMFFQTIQVAHGRSEIGFSFKKVDDDPSSINEIVLSEK